MSASINMANDKRKPDLEKIRNRGKEWLVNCALEGIYPTQETLNDLELLNSGKMIPDEYREYITEKYREKSQVGES